MAESNGNEDLKLDDILSSGVETNSQKECNLDDILEFLSPDTEASSAIDENQYDILDFIDPEKEASSVNEVEDVDDILEFLGPEIEASGGNEEFHGFEESNLEPCTTSKTEPDESREKKKLKTENDKEINNLLKCSYVAPWPIHSVSWSVNPVKLSR